ncbi:porin [Myroides sp. LJL119]
MKKFLTTGVLLAMFTMANAQEKQNAFIPIKETSTLNEFNFYLDTRYQYKSDFGPNLSTANGFQVDKTRIYLTSKVKDKLSFVLRYDLNASESSNALEAAFFEYRINPNWAIAAGKLFTAWGTYEIDYNGGDIYSNMTLLNNLPVYAPGVNIAYFTNNQRFNLQITSQDNQFASPSYQNKAYGYMFLWQGSLLQDKLRTRYGYGLLQHDSDKFYNWLTIGNQLRVKRWFAELDWVYGFRNINFDPNQELTTPGYMDTYVKENAVGLSLKYHFDTWNPAFKVIYNKRDALDQGAAFKLWTLEGTMEFYPFKYDALFKDIRLFASYSYNLTQYTKDVAYLNHNIVHKVQCGVRWLIPLVKTHK